MTTGLPLQDGKYARIERERRFLLEEPPPASAVTATRLITDRYLTGTRLRLRRQDRLVRTSHAELVSLLREFGLTR